jgi:hypothetical protein
MQSIESLLESSMIKYIFLKIFFPGARLTLEYGLFNFLNKERKRYGLPKLFFQNDLQRVARKHSKDMAQNDYFDHTNLDNKSPQDRFKQAEVSEVISGENLAKVRGFKNPVKTAHVGLMNSPGHKANILQKAYNCVGIGLSISTDKTYYFTQNFSYRKLYILGNPKIIRFNRKLKFKLKIIDPTLKKVLVRIYDLADTKVSELVVDVSSVRVKKCEFEIKNKGKYSVKIYENTNNQTEFKLINEFKFRKIGFLW